jgi:flagellar biosynthesis regulator FlaF
MDQTIRQNLDDIRGPDKAAQNRAYEAVIAATDSAVDWAYDVWDEVVTDLRHKDNHVRAIASQLLCNLAKSDPEVRLTSDFPALLNVTRDERFVTARHCLQSLWKVGVAGPRQREIWREGVVQRFTECRAEKNWSLIRYDILQSMRNVYDVTQDDGTRTTAQELIDSETDDKYRKKYAKVWKDV